MEIAVQRKAPNGLAVAGVDGKLWSKEEARNEGQLEETGSLPLRHTLGLLEWGNKRCLHCFAWSSAVLRPWA